MDNATTDRFKHVQRPIMINDCDVSIEEASDSLLLTRNVTDRFVSALILSVGERFTGLVTSFFSIVFAEVGAARKKEEGRKIRRRSAQ